VLIAVRDRGSFEAALPPEDQVVNKSFNPAQCLLVPIHVSQNVLVNTATFVESRNPSPQVLAVKAKLSPDLNTVQIDSQCRYAILARGQADAQLHYIHNYDEKIWDHAAGSLIVEEAGGIVSDWHGQPLDFTCGRTLRNNLGVIAASTVALHNAILTGIHQAPPPGFEPSQNALIPAPEDLPPEITGIFVSHPAATTTHIEELPSAPVAMVVHSELATSLASQLEDAALPPPPADGDLSPQPSPPLSAADAAGVVVDTLDAAVADRLPTPPPVEEDLHD
jgi:hypothetical protein